MDAFSKAGTKKAFELLKSMPRVTLNTLKPNPGAKTLPTKTYKQAGLRQKSAIQRGNYAPAGFEFLYDYTKEQAGTRNVPGNFRLPYFKKFKSQNWNEERETKLAYQSLTLDRLQLMIDLGRIPTNVPIDMTQLSISGMLIYVKADNREGGYLLQDEDVDSFSAQINLEVQWATEATIAAAERAGSTITVAYYDPISVLAASNPEAFFKRGEPIPRRMFPPKQLIDYYSDPKNRGYLADPEEIARERFVLAQKYGYDLPDLEKSEKRDLLTLRKDPRQVFHGLQPGWVVSLKDKKIIKPTDQKLKEYYRS